MSSLPAVVLLHVWPSVKDHVLLLYAQHSVGGRGQGLSVRVNTPRGSSSCALIHACISHRLRRLYRSKVLDAACLQQPRGSVLPRGLLRSTRRPTLAVGLRDTRAFSSLRQPLQGTPSDGQRSFSRSLNTRHVSHYPSISLRPVT